MNPADPGVPPLWCCHPLLPLAFFIAIDLLLHRKFNILLFFLLQGRLFGECCSLASFTLPHFSGVFSLLAFPIIRHRLLSRFPLLPLVARCVHPLRERRRFDPQFATPPPFSDGGVTCDPWILLCSQLSSSLFPSWRRLNRTGRRLVQNLLSFTVMLGSFCVNPSPRAASSAPLWHSRRNLLPGFGFHRNIFEKPRPLT